MADIRFARAVARLLQKPVHAHDEVIWNLVLEQQHELRAHFNLMGLNLIMNEAEGYAFLRQVVFDEEGTVAGYMRRRPLTYWQSIVCVLLRQWMEDDFNEDTHRLFITPSSFRERLDIFFPDKADRIKLESDMDRLLEKMVDLDLVRRQERAGPGGEDLYEVLPIIRDRVDIETLQTFAQQIKPSHPQPDNGQDQTNP